MKRYLSIIIVLILLLVLSLGGCQDIIKMRQRGWPNRTSIGIYIGDSPFNFTDPENVINPALTADDVTDVPAHMVADPFMIKEGSTWYMFIEIMNNNTNDYDISVATSNDGFEWTYQRIVLDEPFPVSYPYVFKWMDDFYMMPSSAKSGGIRLYKAVEFPYEWSFEGTLIEGVYFDSTSFRYDNRWWIYAGSSSEPRANDMLHLFYADDLMGPWHLHPESPIVDGNANKARPSGRVLVFEDKIIRYSQDCYPEYGLEVNAFIITELTTSSYKEEAYPGNPIITGSGTGWNADKMHHIDPHQIGENQWIACVDGFDKDYYLTFWKDK